MKKLLLFALAICFIAGSSLAQISFGPKVGINMSTFNQNFKDSDDESDLTFKFGQSIGGIVNIQIADFLAFQPSLSIINKGTAADLSEWDGDGYTYDGYNRMRITYLEMPLNIVFVIDFGSSSLQFFTGPYFALAIAGNLKWDYTWTYQGDTEIEKGDKKIKFKNEVGENDWEEGIAGFLRPLDVGMNLGVGFQINHLLLNMGYSIGFANLQPDDADPGSDFDRKDYRFTNSTVFVTAAWLFGGK